MDTPETPHTPERGGRSLRLGQRERWFELMLTVAFALCAGALIASDELPWAPPAATVPLIVAYALASLVVCPLGPSDRVPTQPFLIALFAFAPAPVVPLLVWIGLLLGRAVRVLTSRHHPERLLCGAGDAVHALGPAALLLAAGVQDGHAVTLPLIVAAFAAQVVFDSLCATVRESALHRIDPELQLPVVLRLAAFDGALIPLGVLVGAAVDDMPLAPLGLLPLLAVLAYAVRDRTARRTARTAVEALGGGRAPATAAPAGLDNRTGLVDRGRFRELLGAALERHRETGAGVSLILFDVDHLADVNDAFGHDTGDDVLRAVADLLRAECRSTDEPARYGADELAVVLPGVSLDEARRLAERVRGRIAELDATAPDGWPLRITASAGAAALDGRVAGAGQLMAAAERALCRAKARGRNRVEVHSGTQCDADCARGRCSPTWRPNEPAPGGAAGRSVTTDA